MKFLKPISFKYKASNEKIYPGRITGTGEKQGVKMAIAEYYYNDIIGWKEISSNNIKKDLYKKYEKQIKANK